MRLILALVLLATSLQAAEIKVFFSPKGGCTEAVVQNLKNAKSNVLVQAYSFTSAPIAKALVDAHKRGVNVQVVLDRSQRTAQYSSATFLFNAGVPTFIDAQHAIAHNKIMVIDCGIVMTGSFNFTKNAEESNAENLLVISDPPLAQKYISNWQLHRSHSEKYTGKLPAERRTDGRRLIKSENHATALPF